MNSPPPFGLTTVDPLVDPATTRGPLFYLLFYFHVAYFLNTFH
jgi:hypothetical protein